MLPAIIADYTKKSGDKVEISYASSATLATQILNGAPYDLFLAANQAFPQRVVDAGLAVETKPVIYAEGTLVLWARNGVLHDPLTLRQLTEATVKHIAVADPIHAPYGAAAMAALYKLGLFDALQPKLVFAENIAQAAQFAQSGNAQCALISATLAVTADMQRAGRYVLLPKGSYPPIEQGAVVMRSAAAKASALEFLDYLGAAAGSRLLQAGGLHPAPGRP